MSLFYDSISRKPKPLVKVLFILIPVLMVVALWFIGQDLVKKKAKSNQESEEVF